MKAFRYIVAILLLLGSMAPSVLQGQKTPIVAEPSAELKSLVEPVRSALAGHPQRAEVSSYFGTVADAIERDASGPKYLKTCESLRAWNAVAESRFRGELSPKVDGLADKLNGVFLGWVGPESTVMDAERYRKASEAARAIQWAASK